METKSTVKLEMNNICRGCLSADRNLKPLSKDCADIFWYILGTENFIPEDSMYFNLLVCWECTSVLRKISIYQKRFRTSQIVFLRNWIGPFSIESLSLLSIFNKNDCDTSLKYEEEQIKDTKIELDINIDKLDFETKDEKKYEITIKENISNDFVDDIPKNNDSDDFVDISDKMEVKKKKKYPYIKSICKKIMKCSRASYSSGIESHIESVQLKIEYIKDIISNGKKIKGSILSRMFTAMKEIINTMNSDLKQDETNANGVKCSHCEIYLSNRHLLKEHWNEHTVDAINCIYCERMTIYTSEMSRHLKSCHKYNFECECGYVCRHRATFYLHYKKYHTEFVCHHCKSRYLRKERLEKHIRETHLPNKCDLCGRVYKNKTILRTHYWAKHEKLKGQTSELTYCVECDMQFDNDFLYNRHLKRAVAHNPVTAKPKKSPCPDCGKIFSKTCYMNRHYNLVHKKKTKFYCEICDKYLSSPYAMRNHNKYIHLKEERKRDKMCQICGKYFFSNAELIKHTRTHTGERPFKCRFCDSAFTQQTSRDSHERTQHKAVKKCENKME